MSQRLAWIDILKGIGIVSVVAGHVLGWRYMFSFHVPLFFIISGYTFRVREDVLSYFRRSVKRLLYPYVSFLVVVSLASSLLLGSRPPFHDLFFGGTLLKKAFGTFWFVTVMFLALTSLNVILRYFKNRWIILIVCLFLSYFFKYLRLDLAWDAQVVPMAMAYMLVGGVIKDCENSYALEYVDSKVLLGFFSFAFLLPFVCGGFYIDMKYTDYGIPLIAFVNSIVIVLVLIWVSRKLANSMLKDALSFLGRASLVIMFLHQLIHFTLSAHGVPNKFVLTFSCILIPSLVFKMLDSNRVLRTLFLGIGR